LSTTGLRSASRKQAPITLSCDTTNIVPTNCKVMQTFNAKITVGVETPEPRLVSKLPMIIEPKLIVIQLPTGCARWPGNLLCRLREQSNPRLLGNRETELINVNTEHTVGCVPRGDKARVRRVNH